MAVEAVQRDVEQLDELRQAGLVARVHEPVADEEVERGRAARRLVLGRQHPRHHLLDGHELERLHLAVGVARHEIRGQLQVVNEFRVREQAALALKVEPDNPISIISELLYAFGRA